MNYYNKIISELHTLKENYTKLSMGKHLSSALDDSDLWAISDKELYMALVKYSKQLALDVPHNEEEIENIIKDGMKLDRIYLLDEDNGSYE